MTPPISRDRTGTSGRPSVASQTPPTPAARNEPGAASGLFGGGDHPHRAAPGNQNEANTLKHLKMTATVALPASDMEAAELMVASKPAWHAFCEAIRTACPGVETKLEVVTPEPVRKERKRRVVAVVDHKPSARRAGLDAA
jgi:hypothetical protein